MWSPVGMRGRPSRLLAGVGRARRSHGSVEGSRSHACRKMPAVSEPHPGSGWRQYLLEDHTGQVLPPPLKPSLVHVQDAVCLD